MAAYRAQLTHAGYDVTYGPDVDLMFAFRHWEVFADASGGAHGKPARIVITVALPPG
jgi:hypothetical protein